MDVNCFQNLMPVKTSASLASQSVSSKRTVQEPTTGFASTLENTVAAKQSAIVRQGTVGNEKTALEKPVLENEIIAGAQAKELDENFHERSDSQKIEMLFDPKEILENIAVVPQADLPQPGIPVSEKTVPDAVGSQLNQTADLETNLLLKNENVAGEKNNLDFKLPDNLIAKEQTTLELSAFKGHQPIANGSAQVNLGQNAEVLNQSKENLTQNANLLANQAELLKDIAGEAKTTQTSQMPLESSIAKAVELNPKALEINSSKQTVTPNSELLSERINNLSEKNPSDHTDQQRQNGQQSQSDKMPFPNTEAVSPAKDSDQPVNSSITFNVPTDTQPINNKVELTSPTGQNSPNFTLPQDQFQIRSQIVNQAVLINKENQESEMIIRLKPEHLGDLTLKVNVSNGVVNANFHSNNSEVRGLLEASLHQLKQDLANAGFKVDNVSISAGLSQFTAEQDRQLGWQQQRQTSKTSGKNAGNGYVEGIDSQITGRTGVNYSKDDGVDYLI